MDWRRRCPADGGAIDSYEKEAGVSSSVTSGRLTTGRRAGLGLRLGLRLGAEPERAIGERPAPWNERALPLTLESPEGGFVAARGFYPRAGQRTSARPRAPVRREESVVR